MQQFNGIVNIVHTEYIINTESEDYKRIVDLMHLHIFKVKRRKPSKILQVKITLAVIFLTYKIQNKI